DIIEGFPVMSALATDHSLCELDKTAKPNHRRACRPFSTNTGFTLAESAQFFIIMDDELALELGATIYGSVADTFVSADANKKSIASPGVGNYVTFAKAAALTNNMFGQTGLQNTYVQAHGTGTPQNRTTESHIMNEVAKTFGVQDWAVTAVKSYLGHSISVAAGDQLATSLGVWQYGWIPGIKTIDHIAGDVYHSNLNILMDHMAIKPESVPAVIINSKGFGGNNASSVVISPHQTLRMLSQRYGQSTMTAYKKKNEAVKEQQSNRDAAACQGQERIFYNFGNNIMDATGINLTQQNIRLSEFEQPIDLPQTNPYSEYF
ncbi:MAG: beta-ketoacyl synthase, partial [Gammaproteobacteria bacterium]